MLTVEEQIELEIRAREHLSPGAHAYFTDAAYSDAAGRRTTAVANELAWSRWHLRPRVLRDVSSIELAVSAMGCPVSMPVLTAPCAYNAFAHADAEPAVARAVARAGTLPVISTASSMMCASGR